MNEFNLLATLMDLTGAALSRRMLDVIEKGEKLSAEEIKAIRDLSGVCNKSLECVALDRIMNEFKGL